MNHIFLVFADVIGPGSLIVVGGIALLVVGGLGVSIGVLLFAIVKRKKKRRSANGEDEGQ